MPPSATVAAGGRRRPVTRDLVIEKILRWNELYGEPPRTADWNPSLARWRAQPWRAERYRLGDPETGEPWPSINAAKSRFGGSFDAAVRAAGLEPHRPGPGRAPSSIPPIAQTPASTNGTGPVGPGPLAAAVRDVARARATGDRLALDAALARVASAASRWRDRL